MTTGMSAGQTSCLPVGGASRLAPYKGVAGAIVFLEPALLSNRDISN